MFNFKVRAALLLIFSLIFAACAAPQKTVYFRTNAPQDSLVASITGPTERETVIQPDDILAISITSISSLSDRDPVGIFQQGGTPFMVTAGGANTSNGGSSTGYLVDKEGFVDYPALGKLRLGGLSIRQAKENIALRLKDYVKEPVVEVRILNFKVVVLGEVGAQGTILAPNHKLSIIEAIAASGGIPASGRKENVMVIRENNGRRDVAYLNLNSREVFKSPYYYLRQNDIVYVEPSRIRRQESNEFLRLYLPIGTTLLSTALTVYGIVRISGK